LAKHPSQIILGEVVRFIDGPIEPIACVEKGYAGCTDMYKCVFRKIWVEVGKSTSKIVDNITFEELANRVQATENVLAYQI
jgi:DNA-binding IscR family transcriptional regulator